jgi:transcriptional regulator with XRE-family HTH domain
MTPAALTAWRKRLDLSAKAAALALGCSRNAFASWEGGRTPIPKYIALACAAFEIGAPYDGEPTGDPARAYIRALIRAEDRAARFLKEGK